MSFLDDILDKGKTVVSSASKKTDTAVRFSKLKVKESQLNADIKSKNEKLGAVIYDMSKTGVKESEEFDALLAQIDEDYAKLAEVESQLDELKNVVTCPKCGAKTKNDNAYCPKCGAKLPEKKVEEAPAAKETDDEE